MVSFKGCSRKSSCISFKNCSDHQPTYFLKKYLIINLRISPRVYSKNNSPKYFLRISTGRIRKFLKICFQFLQIFLQEFIRQRIFASFSFSFKSFFWYSSRHLKDSGRTHQKILKIFFQEYLKMFLQIFLQKFIRQRVFLFFQFIIQQFLLVFFKKLLQLILLCFIFESPLYSFRFSSRMSFLQRFLQEFDQRCLQKFLQEFIWKFFKTSIMNFIQEFLLKFLRRLFQYSKDFCMNFSIVLSKIFLWYSY